MLAKFLQILVFLRRGFAEAFRRFTRFAARLLLILGEVGGEVLGDETAQGEPHHVGHLTDAALEHFSVIGRHLAGGVTGR